MPDGEFLLYIYISRATTLDTGSKYQKNAKAPFLPNGVEAGTGTSMYEQSTGAWVKEESGYVFSSEGDC